VVPEQDKSELLKQLTIDRSEPPAKIVGLPQLVIVVVVTAIVSAGITLYLFPSPLSPTNEKQPPISTAELANMQSRSAAVDTRSNEKVILNASGYITARRVATVSAEIMGLIVSVDVEEGMRVEKRQILARLDDSVARVNLRLAEAQVQVQRELVNSIESDQKEAERVLKRLSTLGKENFSSEAQRTRAEADLSKLNSTRASAKAELNVVELNVERERERLGDHTIRAPFGGVITVKNAQPGEIVAPAAAGGGYTRTGICTLVDMDSLEIEVDVNEAFIGRVVANQKVIANLDAYADWDLAASVIAIIPTADRAKATVKVRIKIHTRDERILPNMGVKVAFFDEQA